MKCEQTVGVAKASSRYFVSAAGGVSLIVGFVALAIFVPPFISIPVIVGVGLIAGIYGAVRYLKKYKAKKLKKQQEDQAKQKDEEYKQKIEKEQDEILSKVTEMVAVEHDLQKKLEEKVDNEQKEVERMSSTRSIYRALPEMVKDPVLYPAYTASPYQPSPYLAQESIDKANSARSSQRSLPEMVKDPALFLPYQPSPYHTPPYQVSPYPGHESIIVRSPQVTIELTSNFPRFYMDATLQNAPTPPLYNGSPLLRPRIVPGPIQEKKEEKEKEATEKEVGVTPHL